MESSIVENFIPEEIPSSPGKEQILSLESESAGIGPTIIGIAGTMVNGLGSLAWIIAQNSFLRKATLSGVMYFAGGTIVATVGLAPTIIASGIILVAT